MPTGTRCGNRQQVSRLSMNHPPCYTYFDGPLGQILLAWDETGLTRINFQGGNAAFECPATWRHTDSDDLGAIDQFRAYFAGRLTAFDLPLAPQGTAFQMSVWRALEGIPYGRTASYGQIARQIDRPAAVRAVGAANGRNPLPVVIPCHRVVGSDGRLTGYTGGLHIKEFLLNLEQERA